MKVKWLPLISYLLTINDGKSVCLSPSPLSLQLILEYACWRSWEQIVLFDVLDSSSCALRYAMPLISCLGEKGISVSIQSASSPKLPEALEIRRHRIGSVVLLDGLNLTSSDNVLKVASNKRLFNYYISWFLVTSRADDAIIDTTLRNLTIGINTDVVVGTAFHSSERARQATRSHSNRTCNAFRMYNRGYSFDSSTREDRQYATENITKNLDYSILENRTMAFYLVHVYKIRISDNSSLVVDPLGSWNPGAPSLKLPVSTEMRNNFNGLPIVVGILNGTNDGTRDSVNNLEEEIAEVQPLHEFVDFLASSLNARMQPIAHEKLGTVTNKVWNNLLGDVYNGNVDLGLGYITITDDRQRDMSFTHPLIRYTRNIYIRPPESGSMRDIFLQPFNNRMLLCVALMHFLIIVAIGTINYAARNVLETENKRQAGLGEATLWCISILCMQGSPWSPTSISGKTALLASLVFALVTYNAYAGFITSILSVQATGIRTLEDVLRNNFKLGYSNADDEYMRNANDSDLRQLYIKAFNGRESQLDTTLGLQKAMKGGYGFFVSATLARRALGTSLIQERCSIKEIEVRQTFTIVALPMEKASPYAKIINLSLLRMRERGVIDRIREKMLPDMPKCQALTTFHSARIADVYSAFIILMIGLVTSTCLGIFERIWDQRRTVKNKIMQSFLHRRGFLMTCARSEKNFHHHGKRKIGIIATPFSFPIVNKNRGTKNLLETRYKPKTHRLQVRYIEEEKSRSFFNVSRISGSFDNSRIIVAKSMPDQAEAKLSKRDKLQIFPFQN